MIESSIGWLAPAVAAEPDVTMKRLPLGCICYMLMMAYMSDSTATDSSSSSQAKGQPVKPLTRTAPQLVLDAEAAAEAAEGGEAEGVKAAHAALVRLRAPLRSAVSAALTDESKEDKAGMALGLFLSEVGHPSSKRRSAARKALESIMGLASEAEEAAAAAMDVVDEEEEDDSGGIKTRKPFKASELSGIIRSKRFLSQAAKEHCSWVFRLDRLPSLRQSKRPVLDALSQALQASGTTSQTGEHRLAGRALGDWLSVCHGGVCAGGGVSLRDQLLPAGALQPLPPHGPIARQGGGHRAVRRQQGGGGEGRPEQPVLLLVAALHGAGGPSPGDAGHGRALPAAAVAHHGRGVRHHPGGSHQAAAQQGQGQALARRPPGTRKREEPARVSQEAVTHVVKPTHACLPACSTEPPRCCL